MSGEDEVERLRAAASATAREVVCDCGPEWTSRGRHDPTACPAYRCPDTRAALDALAQPDG